jgi:2-dehydro-3-deoxygluconokinase
VKYDGVGREARNGLNFTERGFGPRAGVGCYDRGHTAISRVLPGQIDWSEIFGRAGQGVRWLHTGGVFSALSESTPLVACEAMQEARRCGTRISYDLNYRDSLWRSVGGAPRAQEVNRSLMPFIDVLFGSAEQLSLALGVALDGPDERQGSRSRSFELATARFRTLIDAVVAAHPNIRTVATTVRTAPSASVNGWGAVCYHEGAFYDATPRDIEILDRVGGGDSFASGFIYGLLADKDPQWALECGVAHGSLAMSTPGDASMATLNEVLKRMAGADARIDR